jgi:hypothetical protein
MPKKQKEVVSDSEKDPTLQTIPLKHKCNATSSVTPCLAGVCLWGSAKQLLVYRKCLVAF